MMEQVYGTTEDQIREVKSIARRFLGKTQNYQSFSKSFKTSVEEQVNKKVLGLLQEQKPKVLVYGIYNAGKSTLVNVLCGKEVAEVGDRPTTAKTQPYDAGKYILMDTPGIDAPIKHEMEADENMNNCHVILFVVSSKGGFESRKNYERMVEMIQRGLPFYIILNDRGSATTDEQEHQRELESIQQKIITNLIQVSGDDHIDEKYEVITLNTKRAWTGIQKGKQILVEKSGIRALQLRLENLLRENGALQWLSTPLSTLKELLEKATDELQKQLGNQEYAERRKKLMDEYKHFETAFLADANSILNAKRDAIFQACLAHEESNLRQVIDEGAKQTQDAFEKDQKPLQGLLETISNAPLRLQASMQDYLEGDPLSIGSIGSAGKSTFSKAGVLAGPAAQAAEKAIAAGFAGLGALSSGAAVISGALTKAIPVIGWGITAISILDGIFNAGKRREEREYERAEREAELANQQAQARYQQEKLRRQNANSETTRIMDEIRQQQREFFAQKVQSVVDKKIQEIEAQIRQQEAMDKTIRDFLEELDNWKETLRNIQTALT